MDTGFRTMGWTLSSPYRSAGRVGAMDRLCSRGIAISGDAHGQVLFDRAAALAPGEDDNATQSAVREEGTGSSVQVVKLEPLEQEPPGTPAADLGNAAQDLGELWTE